MGKRVIVDAARCLGVAPVALGTAPSAEDGLAQSTVDRPIEDTFDIFPGR
jgi:hypothetical protein